MPIFRKIRKMKKPFFIILFLVFAEVLLAVPETPFIVPTGFQKDVDFWGKVYREWDTHQVVFYDGTSKAVYDVLDLPVVPKELSAQKYRKEVQKHQAAVLDELKRLNGEEVKEQPGALAKKIEDVVKKNTLPKEDLVGRLKVQSGLRTQFQEGLRISGRYVDDMKAVLKAYQLPEELYAIVFVESLFAMNATSHAGASGPWGIMKNTGLELGIHINNFTDERVDPVVSTWAAARYLKKSFEGLQSWPLAITSYNYGYPGMMRAKKNLNTTDLSIIKEQHDGGYFGYASKNYYTEFLAALDCIKNQNHYFPEIKKEVKWQYDLVQLKRPANALDLVSFKVITKDNLSNLNPSLSKLTINGKEVIPSDYSLRVPKGKADNFYAQIKKVPESNRKKAENFISSKYKVRGKETIYTIAKKHGISATALSAGLKKEPSALVKGTINIRSRAHLFSQLAEIHKGSGIR